MIRTTPNKLFLLPYKFEVDIIHLFRGYYLVSKYGNADSWIKRRGKIFECKLFKQRHGVDCEISNVTDMVKCQFEHLDK